jgi:hypothetical protein
MTSFPVSKTDEKADLPLVRFAHLFKQPVIDPQQFTFFSYNFFARSHRSELRTTTTIPQQTFRAAGYLPFFSSSSSFVRTNILEL